MAQSKGSMRFNKAEWKFNTIWLAQTFKKRKNLQTDILDSSKKLLTTSLRSTVHLFAKLWHPITHTWLTNNRSKSNREDSDQAQRDSDSNLTLKTATPGWRRPRNNSPPTNKTSRWSSQCHRWGRCNQMLCACSVGHSPNQVKSTCLTGIMSNKSKSGCREVLSPKNRLKV